MDTLTTVIAEHRANHHPLFRYLKTHAEDAVAWDIFATHYARALAPLPYTVTLLRARLHAEAQEILDHLMETTAATRLLLPPGFVPLSDEVLTELEHLPEVEHFCTFHDTSMKVKPLPVALGIVYTQCLTPEWIERMDLIIAPFVERMDLLILGVRSALAVRDTLWEGILESITGEPR